MNRAANDTQQVLDMVQRWAAAELAGDIEAHDQLLTADFTGVGPVGFVLTSEQWAKRHLGDLHIAVRAGRDWRIAHIQLSGPLIRPGETPSFAR